MAVEIFFGLLVDVVAEIKVDCVCSTRVNSAVEFTLIVPKNPETLSFRVEHNSTYGVVLGLSGNQKCGLFLGVCSQYGKEVS